MANRQLWPTDNSKPSALTPRNQSFNLTEDAYNAIIEAIEAVNTRVTNTNTSLEDYKDALASEITSHLGTFDSISVTDRADIVNAVVDTLTATSATIPTLNSNDITTVDLTAQRAAIDEIVNVTSADIATVNATTVNADEGNFESLHVDTLDADSYQIEQAAISDFTSEMAQVEEAIIATADIANGSVGNLTATNAAITEATIDKAELTDNYSQRIFNVYFNHNKLFNRQVIDSASISADGDCWCVLPRFKNGHFYLIAKNGQNGPFLWSLEVNNSIKNCMFRWSNNSEEVQYLKDIEFIDDEQTGEQFIQVHFNTNNLATHVYFQCTDYDTHEPPSYYAVKQFDGTKQFEFTRKDGTCLPNASFLGEFHAESMEIDQVRFDTVYVGHSIELPTEYDQYGAPINYARGEPHQYITNIENDYDNDEIGWVNPIHLDEPGRLADSKYLVDEAAVTNYNGEREEGITYTDAYTDGTDFYANDFSSEDEPEGTITATANAGNYIDYSDKHYRKTVNAEDPTIIEYFEVDHFTDIGSLVEDQTLIDALDLETPVAYTRNTYKTSAIKYNIKHLGDGTTTHGDHEVEGDLVVKENTALNDHLFIGETADLPSTIKDDALVIFTDSAHPEITRRRKFSLVPKLDPVMVKNSDTVFVDKKPVLYNESRDAFETTDKIDIQEGNFNRVVTDTLYVNGTAHINNTEEHDVEGDYLTLRANNNSALANGTYSGIIINHYNSEGDLLMIVADNTGTARLGTGSGARTTYSELYYDGNIYFTDPEDKAGTTVEPQGVLIEWQSYEKTDDYEHWTDAEWIVITFADTKPFLLREETVNLNDKALLAWDATHERAFDIPLPENDEDQLTAHVVGNTQTTTVFTDGTNFYGADLIPTTEPSGTAGTPTTVGQFIFYDDVWFAVDGSTFYDSVDSFTDNTNWTEVTDPELIAMLEAQTPVTISEVEYTETLDPTITYEWASKAHTSLIFDSMAEYTAYAATHNVPDGSAVYIRNENDYLMGENLEVE